MSVMREQITAGILAGGAARRLGGRDKGWYPLDGQALIEHTISRVAPQAVGVLISANRSLDRYRALGWPVVADTGSDYRGPLAGLVRLLECAPTEYLLVVPVDTPRLPLDLGARLGSVMRPDVDIVVAQANGRRQPLHALMRRDLAAGLAEALAAGVARVGEWQDSLRLQTVDWPDGDAFANINAPTDAQRLAKPR